MTVLSSRRRGARTASLVLATLTVTTIAFGASPPSAHAAPGDVPTDALILDYDFEPGQVVGATVADQSAKHLDGSIVNVGSSRLVEGRTPGSQALELTGGPADSTTAPYVQVPKGLFQGVSKATVSAWTKWDGTAGFQWLWCLGASKDAASFFTPSFVEGDSTAQARVKQLKGGGETGASSSVPLAKGAWVNVTATMDGDTIVLYLDGLEVASAPASIDLAAQLFSPDAPSSGNIGRALWDVHPYYAGAIDDFRVYDTALSAAQVRSLVGDANLPTVTKVLQTSVTVFTAIGTAPQLPGVSALYSDGVTRPADVTWDAVPASAYATRGTFTVQGKVTQTGDAVTAKVTARTQGELTIDLSTRTGAFLGGASGTLYGVYGEGLPSRNLLEGINLRTVATKAQDGPQHPGADALEVVKAVADSSGGDVYIYMTDIYRGFPYQVPGATGEEKWADYKTKIAAQVDQVLTLPKKYQDRIVFIPFNEPEGNMFGSGQESFYQRSWLDDPTAFFKAWDEAYALIKAKMPDARLAGPNTSVLFNQDEDFLKHTVAAGTVPAVFTWHELSNPASIRTNVDRYRAWEDKAFAGTPYAGKHLPINIDEYAFNYHTSVPGQMIQWFSALEDKKVDGDIAYWNIDGNLTDSAVQANRGNGQWWLLHAYSQMSGDTVAVTPPKPNENYTLQGIGTLDSSKKQARALFGGSGGPQSVAFTGVDPAVFGAKPHVQVNEIRWTGQVGDSRDPETVKEFDADNTNGAVLLDFGGSLPALDADSAYEVILSPGGHSTSPSASPVVFRQKYEVEDAAYTGGPRYLNGPEGTPTNQGGYYTSGQRDVGGIKAGSTLKLNFAVDVPVTGTYDLSVFANSLNTFPANAAQGPINAFLSVDGAAEQQIYLPLAYKFVVWDHADTRVRLSAGKHTITLAARSLDGTRSTVGDAIVDKIELSLPSPAATSEIYEAENATLAGGAKPDYATTGASGAGTVKLAARASTTFWVYSRDDAPATLALDATGKGTADVTVNGVKVVTLSGRSSRQVFLSGGINKITVTGTAGALALDRLTVGPGAGVLKTTAYEAESAAITGPAVVRDLPLASGGKAVGQIGGGRTGSSSLTFGNVQAKAGGTYALTLRYSNEEQSPATHYNPDPLARTADITVNGVTQRVTFPHTFHQDQLWDLTVPVTLKKGTNTVSITSKELPGFDGRTYLSDTFPGILLKSQYAPNIDKISVTPFTDVAAPTAPSARPRVTSAKAPSADGWYAQGVRVALRVPAGYKAQYRVDGQSWRTYSRSVTITRDGTHTVNHRLVQDSAVVQGSQRRLTVKIDKTAPRTTATRNPSSGIGTHRKPVTVSLSARDALSGVARTQYKVDKGAWRTYTRPVVLDTAGRHVVGYRSTDKAGHVEKARTVTATIKH